MEQKNENFFLEIKENITEYQKESKNRFEYLKEKIEMAPLTYGCYLWKDQNSNILYIGKSDKIKNRLRSYLKPDNYKHYILLQKSYDVEWIITNNSKEALILEDTLIKQYQPTFNVRLKDDKRYPFICISLSEPYPRVYLTRKYKKDGNRYFGPYTDVRFARKILELIHKIFPIRKVKQELPLKKPKRPCMNYYIKRCLAPCQGNVPEEEYRKIINEVILFLEGKKELLEETIIKRMHKYSEKMEYEKASIYRDILIQLKQFHEKQEIIKLNHPDQDIIVIAYDENFHQAIAVILEFRNSRLLSRKSFSLYLPIDIDLSQYKEELLYSFLREYYLNFINFENFPNRIMIPYKVDGISELKEFLSQKFNTNIEIKIEKNSSMIRLAEKNAALLLKEKILGMKNKLKLEALKEIQTLCNLEKIPEIIECYDISHFGGEETVASGIRFLNGEPNPKSYRHYIIKSVNHINDPQSIYEVIFRRIRRLKEERKRFPDLIVIDGGISQVNFAYKALKEHQIEIPLIGLAKQEEEIYFPENSKPNKFDKNSPGMLLLRQIRDEAHRFGLEHNNKRMRKKIYKSILDAIPNIGKQRKKIILKNLENKSLKELNLEDLIAIEGIGEKLAKQILDKIKK
ncbi:MAG: excinuclease ABC subunit UvrC [Leptonema sp. (in: bacteria)]